MEEWEVCGEVELKDIKLQFTPVSIRSHRFTQEDRRHILTTSCQIFGVTTVGSRASEYAFVLRLMPAPLFAPSMGTLAALFLGLCLLTSLPPSHAPALSLLGPPPPPPNTGGGYVHSLPLASQARQIVSTPALMHLTFERRQRAHAMLERIVESVAHEDGLVRGSREEREVCGVFPGRKKPRAGDLTCKTDEREADLFATGMLQRPAAKLQIPLGAVRTGWSGRKKVGGNDTRRDHGCFSDSRLSHVPNRNDKGNAPLLQRSSGLRI